MTGSEPTGMLALQTIAMPADTNSGGDIFGGWLMSQMDLGSAVLARARARGRVATVAAQEIIFLRPVLVGDVVSIHAAIVRLATTSMTIEIEAWVRRQAMDERTKVATARFVFVAVDEAGRKRPLPEAVA